MFNKHDTLAAQHSTHPESVCMFAGGNLLGVWPNSDD